MTAIQFFRPDEAYGEFSNFYRQSPVILYEEKTYATSEHLYQALKFLGPESNEQSRRYAEQVRLAKTPQMSKILARLKTGGGPQYSWRAAINKQIEEALKNGVCSRPDWDLVKLEKMRMVLKLKFTQSSSCRAVLLTTGKASISEHSPFDFYWGDGGERGGGKNKLGLLLMELRDEFIANPPQKEKRSLFAMLRRSNAIAQDTSGGKRSRKEEPKSKETVE